MAVDDSGPGTGLCVAEAASAEATGQSLLMIWYC